jgi:hypothetical protein
MKFSLILMLIAGALLGLASCAEYQLENRPQIVYSGRGGEKVHISPYPMSGRSAEVWKSDSCWRGCEASCTVQFNRCARGSGAEACRPALDHCDRQCLFQCRRSAGPLIHSFE